MRAKREAAICSCPNAIISLVMLMLSRGRTELLGGTLLGPRPYDPRWPLYSVGCQLYPSGVKQVDPTRQGEPLL